LADVFWPMLVAVSVALVAVSVRSQPRWSNGEVLIQRDWGAVTTILVALPLLIISLTGAAFAYHDNDVLLTTTVVGRPLTLGIWPDQGRYFPLFSREFVALAKVSSDPLFYYSFIALQLVILCIALNIALAELSVGWRTLACVLALSSSGTVILFVEAIYPERNIVFLLAIFIAAVRRFDVRPSRVNMAVALLAANGAMYFKEPTFLLFAAFALVRLDIARRAGRAGWRSMLRPFELALLAATAVFGIQLAILVAGSDNTYVDNFNIGPLSALGRYLRIDPLLLALLICLVFRAVRWRRDRRIDPLWDPLAVGAVVYFVVLVARGLAVDRYMGPVDLIAALYVTREVAVKVSSRTERPTRRALARSAVAAVAILSVGTIGTGAFRAVEHRSVVTGTEELAEFVASYSSTNDGTTRLWFPDTLDYRIMNFAAYLAYSHPDAVGRIELTAPLDFPDGRCVYYREFACSTSTSPQPGDLVVQLPDDTARASDGSSRVRLFEYSWLGRRVPTLFGRLFYHEAPLYSGEQMPDEWLLATVELQM
jgi:hypothetical protein